LLGDRQALKGFGAGAEVNVVQIGRAAHDPSGNAGVAVNVGEAYASLRTSKLAASLQYKGVLGDWF
jgi:hypothetical protein